MKILMVCYGNICRSPIAEGIMKAKMAKYHIKGTVDSAGVLSFHSGEAPDLRAIKISANYNVDISQQRARQFDKSDFDKFDLIFTLDKPVHSAIIALATDGEKIDKVALLMEYAGINNISEVPDPYYDGDDSFDKIFKMIDDACERIAKKLTS